MASPTVRGRTAPAAGLTSTSPASTQVGDLVLVFTFERAGVGVPTHSLHSGADAFVVQQPHDDGSTDGRLSITRKTATQAGAQSYQGVTSSTGSPVAWTGCVVVTAGTFAVGTVTGTGVSATGTGVPNPPLLTLGNTRDWLVLAISAWHHSASATITPTAPTNYANLIEVAGASNGDIACADRSLTAAASEDPGTFGDNITPNGTASATIGIGSIIAQTSGALALDGTSSIVIVSSVREVACGALVVAGDGVITIVSSEVTGGTTEHFSGALDLSGASSIAVASSVRETFSAIAVSGTGSIAVGSAVRETFSAVALVGDSAIAITAATRETFSGALTLAGISAISVDGTVGVPESPPTAEERAWTRTQALVAQRCRRRCRGRRR